MIAWSIVFTHCPLSKSKTLFLGQHFGMQMPKLFRRQFLSFLKKEIKIKWVNDLRYYLSLGDSGIIGNYYFLIDDYEESIFLIHYLRDKDLLAISGWWTSLTTTEVNEIYRMSGMESQIEEDGYFKIKGRRSNFKR